MAKQFVLAGMLAALLPLAGAAAQPIDSKPEIAGTPASRPSQFIAAFSYVPVFLQAPTSSHPSRALLDEIVSWLVASFDLPVASEMPHVEFVPPARIAAMRYGQLMALQPPRAQSENRSITDSSRDVVATYIDETQTIYLPLGWIGTSPSERSILVHEMVHHLQHRAQLKYNCQEERERLAYEAQDKWLALFGTSLSEEFALDPFTVLSKTLCLH